MLVVVDMQNDFITGSFPVPRAEEIIPSIVQLIESSKDVIYTVDNHPPDHCSFKEFPPHCISGTWGAAIDSRIPIYPNHLVVLKGEDKDIEEFSPRREAFASYPPGKVIVVGLAFEYCVAETARTLNSLGWDVEIKMNLTRWVDPVRAFNTLTDLVSEGIKVV